jgi:hypothetical protein
VYGTVTLTVAVTVSYGPAYLQDNHLVLGVGRNQRLDDFPNMTLTAFSLSQSRLRANVVSTLVVEQGVNF